LSRPRACANFAGEALVTAKLFTPIEANRTLPFVRRVMEDILTHGRELRTLWQRDDDLDEHEADRAVEIGERLEELYRELDMIGCSFRTRDFTFGLLDFPAMIEGELVHLCWRHDEPELRHFHRPLQDYADRQEIPAQLLQGSA
jgi:hypothetical protein